MRALVPRRALAHSGSLFLCVSPGQPCLSVTPSCLCAPKQKTSPHTSALPGPPGSSTARAASGVVVQTHPPLLCTSQSWVSSGGSSSSREPAWTPHPTPTHPSCWPHTAGHPIAPAPFSTFCRDLSPLRSPATVDPGPPGYPKVHQKGRTVTRKRGREEKRPSQQSLGRLGGLLAKADPRVTHLAGQGRGPSGFPLHHPLQGWTMFLHHAVPGNGGEGSP